MTQTEIIERLKLELSARAIRTMGPRSPYWNCTVCGAAGQTPVMFKHEPDCLLADSPLPEALWPENGEECSRLICDAPKMRKMLDAINERQTGMGSINDSMVSGDGLRPAGQG